MVTYTPTSLNAVGKRPVYSLDWRVGGVPRGGSGLSSKQKNIPSHWELNPEFSCRLAGNLLATLTDLPSSHSTVVGIDKTESVVTVFCVCHV